MRTLLSRLSRAGLAATLFAIVLALLRLPPVFAETLPLRAMPLALPCLGLAVTAALCGAPRRARPWPGALWALAVVLLALAGVLALRGPAGLRAQVEGPAGILGTLPPGPVDLIGEDLAALPRTRRVALRWSGRLEAPRSGNYRLWATGRGRVELRLDGRLALAGDGERLDAGADVPIGRGAHEIAVDYERVGPGPRLRVGWQPPRSGLLGLSRDETIPPRRLGEPRPQLLWWLTDALAWAAAALVALLALLLPWDEPRALRVARPVSWTEIAVSLAGQLAVLGFMSWPLLLDPAGRGLFGQPDGRLNAWILAWDAHALLSEPWRLFQAPIFHPLPDALAFSENLLLPALLALPAQLWGGPALAYNLALLLGDAVSGLGVQLLVRRVSGDRLAAFAGGALFAAGVQRWVNMAHLHAQFTPFLPFALLAFDRFLEKRSLPRALAVGLLLALQGMSSVYLGAISATLLAVGVALAWLAGRCRPSDLARLAAGFALAAALLWPLARPYLRMRAFQGEEFTLATVANYATTPESYLAGAGPWYESLSRRQLDPDRVRDPLFPGVLPLLLGVAGLAVAPRRYAALALAGSLVAVTLSLGPETALYRWLHDNLLLFRGIRALARFALVPVLALSVLTGLALSGRGALRGLALVLLLAEARVAPIGYAPYTPPSAAARWLGAGSGAVAVLPLGRDDTTAMLDALAHFRPLVNGDSGFMPRPYARAMELLDDRSDDEALRFLRALGVANVVSAEERPWPRAVRFDATSVYAVAPGEAARAPEAAPAQATLWTSGGTIVDLSNEREVGRATFEIGAGDWLERPRLELSGDGVAWREVAAHASLADATLALYSDPRHGRGELRFAPQRARFLRLDPRLPARPGTFGAAP